MLKSYDLAGADPRPITKPEIGGLKRLASWLPENPVIVNIGAAQGVSTLAMLEARPDCFIFSVDMGACPQEYDNLMRAGLDIYRVVRVLGRSQDIGLKWPYQIDMVFIDGDHSKNGVRGDIKAWRPKVRPGGIISFHDYIPEPIPAHIKGRVVYAVDGLMKEHEEIIRVERLIAFRQI